MDNYYGDDYSDIPQLSSDDVNAGNEDFIRRRMMALYQPENAASSAFNAYLTNVPNRSDFQPSIGRKIGAVLAGLGAGAGPVAAHGGQPVGFSGNSGAAFKTSSGILDEPYNQARSDYEENLKPLEFAAQEEGRRNIQNRQFAAQAAGRELQARDLTRKEAKDAEVAKTNEEKLKVSKQRADAYEFHQRHPNYEGRVNSDGILVYYDKDDPTHVINTGMDTGKLSDFDKIDLGIKGKMQEIGAKGEEERKTEEVKQSGRINLKTTPGAGTGKPGVTPKPPTSNQEKIAQFNKANEIRNSDPEMQKYVDIGPNNTFQLKLPMFGDKAMFDKAHDFIYGSPKSSTPTPNNDLRQKAIDTLTKAGKPITEANITYVIGKLGGK